MSAATIASLRAAAEAQKASAERALRTLDEMEARGDTDDDASKELASLASTVAEELGVPVNDVVVTNIKEKEVEPQGRRRMQRRMRAPWASKACSWSCASVVNCFHRFIALR